jgi:hypothetical protein
VEPLTAKLYQDVFTAYRVHDGRRAHLTGTILSQRGMSNEQAACCGTQSGIGARFHFVFEVSPGHEIGVTVHTVDAERTRRLQALINQPAAAIVKVVVATEDAMKAGGGYEFFMSAAKTLRPWGLEVVDVVEAAAPSVSAKRDSRRARR